MAVVVHGLDTRGRSQPRNRRSRRHRTGQHGVQPGTEAVLARMVAADFARRCSWRDGSRSWPRVRAGPGRRQHPAQARVAGEIDPRVSMIDPPWCPASRCAEPGRSRTAAKPASSARPWPQPGWRGARRRCRPPRRARSQRAKAAPWSADRLMMPGGASASARRRRLRSGGRATRTGEDGPDHLAPARSPHRADGR